MTATWFVTRLTCLLLLASAVMLGQSHGYVLFGTGGVTSHVNTSGAMFLGAGGEGVSRIGLGGGAEVGYLARWGSFGGGIGIGSANATFHFNRRRTVVPFVTGGYTLFFRSGHEKGFNFGGGVNWWGSQRIGLKVEVRDHVGLGFGNTHVWAVRAGLIFR
jgi:hypothetical protein